MKQKIIILPILSIIFSSCIGIQIPSDKQTYIGKWKGEGTLLEITDDGCITYEKNTMNSKTKMSGPIKKFEGDDFYVNILFIPTKFNVDKPPYKDGNVWKMTVDGTDLVNFSSNTNRTIPNIDELKKMVNQSFVKFNNSLIQKSFISFYNTLSKLAQSQTSEVTLENTYKNFTDNNVTLSETIDKEIVFSNEPFIDENNKLNLEGYFLTKPTVYFTITYIYEYPDWKIYDFFCEIK